MPDTTTQAHASLHIEFYNSKHVWTPTGSAPMPFHSTDDPNILPESVWRAYVDYLNERERYAPEKTGYRLVRYSTHTTTEVIHV